MDEDELRRVQRGYGGESAPAISLLDAPRSAAWSPTIISDPIIGCLVEGRYLVTRLIASGGMGCVYEGRDIQRGDRVALKTLLLRFAAKPEFVQRFLREAHALARTRSPHVAAVAARGRLPDGRAYYAMEYLEGICLADLLEARKGPLPPSEVMGISLQLAAALEDAHAFGVIHRDLKPENVLLCPREGGVTLKLLDFGLAKLSDGSMDLTRVGEVLGTPGYMAPEQIRGQLVDERTDIYGCGVLLYEMFTGRLPFEGVDVVDLMFAQTEAPTPRPSHLDPPVWLPPLLEGILMCCLRKAPEERFQTASELRSELAHAARLYRMDA